MYNITQNEYLKHSSVKFQKNTIHQNKNLLIRGY